MKLFNKEMQNSNSVFVNKVQLNLVRNIIPPLSFLKNRKKCPWKKSPDCVHLWIKFFIRNVVLTVSWRKNSKIFPSRVFLPCVFDEMFIEVPQFDETSSALKNFWLRACMGEITLKPMSQTKKKCDSLVLSRSYV